MTDSTPGGARVGPGLPEPLDTQTAALLEATEALRSALESSSDPVAVADAWRRRSEAFESLSHAVRAGAAAGPIARRRLRRVRALDAQLLEIGAALAEAIRDEQANLRRRRAAIRAHAGRERSPARLVAVKA